MDWRLGAAIVAGLIVASLVDWLFAGVLFHDRYQAHPEVWRVNGADPRALIAAQALTIPTVPFVPRLALRTKHPHVRTSARRATFWRTQ